MGKCIFLLTATLISTISFSQKNLQSYTPSILMKVGSWEFKSFQNVYTQTKSFDNSGKKVRRSGGRQSWSTSINQFLFGINGKVNAGMDIWLKNATYEREDISPRTAIVGLGPKIKMAPFNQLQRLSIQSSFLLPLAKRLEGRAGENDVFLHKDGSLWLNQIFYDIPLNAEFQIFFQQAFWYHIVRDSFRENNYLETQTSLFLSFFPSKKWTVYGMTEFFPTHYNDVTGASEFFYSYFVQSGLGLKYQLIAQFLELELLYTNFWMGSNGQGAGQTINLGIRLINQ